MICDLSNNSLRQPCGIHETVSFRPLIGRREPQFGCGKVQSNHEIALPASEMEVKRLGLRETSPLPSPTSK